MLSTATGSVDSTTHFWCVHCLRRYNSKQKYLLHFDRPQVQENEHEEESRGGRQVENQCFNRKDGRQFGKTKSEAVMLKKQMENGRLLRFFKSTLSKSSRSLISQDEPDHSAVEISTVIVNPSSEVENPSSGIEDQASSSNSGMTSDDNIRDPVPTVSPQVSERLRIHSTDSHDCCESIISTPSVVTSVGSSASVEQLNSKIDEVSLTSNKILKLLQSLELGKKSQSNRQPSLEDQPLWFQEARSKYDHEEQIQLLKTAKSMHSVMKNSLVNGIFYFARRDEHGNLIPVEDSNELDETEPVFVNGGCYLVCQLCQANSPKLIKGFRVLDKDYKRGEDCLEDWFKSFRKSVCAHIGLDVHSKSLKEYEKKVEDIKTEIEGVKRSIRYLIYYLIKSNTAFLRYPELLAVANQCGLLIGNINHSKNFPAIVLPLIDGVMLENTAEWFRDQNKITVLLDHGTVFGLVMLVVYFVGDDGQVRLAGCELCASKEGDFTARLCYKICTTNAFLSENAVRNRVKVFCADGAIVDRNGPFKREIRALFNNDNMIFRWDVLHMANRSHIAARGATDIDISNDGGGNTNVRRNNRTLLARTMIYVQTESKRWRTGTAYTGLVLSTVDFLRPKVFSSTRMSLYEFEQMQRFLKVKHYFDVPWQYETMCQLYIFVLLAIKIMLKSCQKTTDQRDYIKRVFIGAHGNEPEGKTAMNLCLRVARDVLRGNGISYLTRDPQVDIVSNDPLDNKFVEAILNLWTTMGDKVIASHLVNPNPLTRNEAQITLNVIEGELERFIEQFWVEFDLRRARTDIDNDETGCFSEAPCETSFSVFDRVTHFRPSLKVENVIRLIRIMMEGPEVGTDASHDLMAAAMQNYRTISHLGERYTTMTWGPGIISKTVRKIIQRVWPFQVFSNF